MTESRRSRAAAWLALIVTVALLVAATYGAALILSRPIAARVAADPSAPAIVPLDLALPAALLLIAAFLVGLSLFKLLAAIQAPPTPEPAEPEATTGDEESAPVTETGVLSLLHILQREGRLIDFLRENIAAFNDEQVGAAARAIHGDCQKALDEHLEIEAVLSQAEGSNVVIDKGFDPSAIRLSGNLSGDPPYRGTLKHHGWRITTTSVPERPESQDERVIAPAEVEVD